MPEIAEVSRIVHFLNKHAVGKAVKAVKTQEDTIVYGKVGTSASAFQEAITGRKIVAAKQQGKYFWLEMDQPPHPLMHFGMSGWMKFSNDHTAYYRPTKPEENVWPPKFWKFILELEDSDCEVAFIDARRLGRIRLIDAKAEDMRKTTPLKENGPDPVIDPDILTVEWLTEKLRKKRVPIKALLLDQANISGIGNWVGDEILYHAKIHPEQYSNTLGDKQIAQLHKSMMYVCNTAIDRLGDSEKFPEDWLFKHRWSKGKKANNTLPNGAKITFLTVGGRTSAVVPSVQKKTGAVAGDVSESAADEDEEEEEQTSKPKAGGKRKKQATKKEAEDESDAKIPPASNGRGRKKAKKDPEDEEVEEKPKTKKPKRAADTSTTELIETGRRRSSRLSKT